MNVGIVTGAARGMGRACATCMVDLVDCLLLVDRDEHLVGKAVDELKASGAANVELFALDITDGEGIALLVSRVEERGTLRAVAHAAGVSPTMADWRTVVAVDLVGTAMLTEAFFPLATAGTALVCFASMASLLVPGEGDAAQNAVLDDPLDVRSLDHLRKVIGTELEDPGMPTCGRSEACTAWSVVRRCASAASVRGSARSHPASSTPRWAARSPRRAPPTIGCSKMPLGREGRPEEVAAATAFLLSDDASFVNGIDVPVDGGVIAALGNQAIPS